MKITAIETIQLPEHPQLLWVHIFTDEGVTGLGETFPRPSSAKRIIHDVFASMLIEKNPLDKEVIFEDLFQAIHYHGYGGAEMRALSAIDIALWDIFGKVTEQPIYRLLGGESRKEIPVYNTCVGHGAYKDREMFLENPGDLAESLLNEGIKAMKIWPFDELSVPTRGQSITTEALRKGRAVIHEIRERVGDDIDIALEGHACWNLPSAIKIAQSLEEYNLMWLEDMVKADHPKALSQLRKATTTPICGSERLFTRFQYLSLIEHQAVDIVMPDITWTGGFTETKRIADLASVHQLPIAPHNCGGPIMNLANAHLCINIPNLFISEVVRAFYHTYFENIVTQPIQVKNGFMQIPEGVGLGAELKPNVLKRNDIEKERSERGIGGDHWAAGDPWKDNLGDRF
ncbi:mandelate racemase/muconate lactonizing enzyme family protein [Salibacterium salarium]|uniref:Mandelate racemase/muconate lactonizing enzyme family protein n=1 Tax=Salibacterium salarium TaxID=284579 RepID=A0A3R9REY9_9BACI|nr:mandelate racemase/muconate lactonizing enzyme family protein [Salibacterium salarium]RSL33967.1 mandelate racemase/muconate lactonizing enzyme family protein [Salibacterium salarium]